MGRGSRSGSGSGSGGNKSGSGSGDKSGSGSGSGSGGRRSGSGSGSGSRSGSGSGSCSLSDLGLTPQQLKSFTEEFKKLDKDNSGSITVSELKPLAVMLQSSNEGPADVDEMLKAADVDDNGELNLRDFCGILQKAQRNKYRVLWESFRMLDDDEDGVIDDKAIGKLLKLLGRSEFEQSKTTTDFKIGMIDEAQLFSKGVNPGYIEMAKASTDPNMRKKLLKKIDKNDRGKLNFEQWCRMLGFMGELTTLSSLSSVSYSGRPSSESDPSEKLGREHKLKGAAGGSGPTLNVYEFYVKGSYKVAFNSSHTVKKLKSLIAEQTGQSADLHRLYSKGMPMHNDDAKLSDLNIQEGETINVVYDAREKRLDKSRSIDPAKIFDHFIHEGLLTVSFARSIMKSAKGILKKLPTMPIINGPCTVVGDIHGQFFDLPNIFKAGGPLGSTPYLFMGDYVDRGYFSAETILYLLAAMVRWPDKVTLLRGNHESEGQTKKPANGTMEEISHKYDNDTYEEMLEVFSMMPPCALVTVGGKKFFCSHGGISKDLETLDDIQAVDRFSKGEREGKGKLLQIMWNDPDDASCIEGGGKHKKKSSKDSKKSGRGQTFKYSGGKGKGGVSKRDYKSRGSWLENKERGGKGIYKYTYKALNAWLEINGVTSLIRGHQQKAGFDIGKPGSKSGFPCMITVFSAPNYTDTSMQDGGLAVFTENEVELRSYGWNHHPVYYTRNHSKKAYQKHVLMEHYVQYLHFNNKPVLQTVSLLHLRSKIEARTFLIKINQLMGTKYVMGDLATAMSDWDFVSENVTESLKLAKDIRVRHLYWTRIKKSPDAVWFEGFDYLADCLLREAQNEMLEISMMDEDYSG